MPAWARPKKVSEQDRAKRKAEREKLLTRYRNQGLKDSAIEERAALRLTEGFRLIIKVQQKKRAAMHQRDMDQASLRDFWNILDVLIVAAPTGKE